jgi:hypothetical protein
MKSVQGYGLRKSIADHKIYFYKWKHSVCHNSSLKVYSYLFARITPAFTRKETLKHVAQDISSPVRIQRKFGHLTKVTYAAYLFNFLVIYFTTLFQ